MYYMNVYSTLITNSVKEDGKSRVAIGFNVIEIKILVLFINI